MISYHNYNERGRAASLIESLRSGESVALVTDAGTPGISDPAYAVIRASIDAGIPVVPVPGPTAFVPALIVSGLPTDRFVFEGFLPVRKGRETRLRALSTEDRTIVLYESPHRIGRTLTDLINILGDREGVLARELTKKFEEIVRGPLSLIRHHLESKGARGELVLVVSPPRESSKKTATPQNV
jgi:16S rRNA (cytidine1402-2'-O)-methyltransferase